MVERWLRGGYKSTQLGKFGCKMKNISCTSALEAPSHQWNRHSACFGKTKRQQLPCSRLPSQPQAQPPPLPPSIHQTTFQQTENYLVSCSTEVSMGACQLVLQPALDPGSNPGGRDCLFLPLSTSFWVPTQGSRKEVGAHRFASSKWHQILTHFDGSIQLEHGSTSCEGRTPTLNR